MQTLMQGTSGAFALDESYVYTADDVQTGILRRRKDQSDMRRKTTSAGSVLGDQLTAFSVDDLYLYFSTNGGVLPVSGTTAGHALKCGGLVGPSLHYQGSNPFPPPPSPLYGSPILLDGAHLYTVLNHQILRLPHQ